MMQLKITDLYYICIRNLQKIEEINFEKNLKVVTFPVKPGVTSGRPIVTKL